jgi:ferritin-like metal-binding protein YciE
MASVASLREHLVEELNDLWDAENQLIEALPKMQQKATQRELKAAFRTHLAETREHARRVKQALRTLEETPSEHTCEAMKGLLEEGEELMESSEGGALRDAMMITAAQKVEHYEIATYGTVRTYAQILGQSSVARLMAQTLKEEKAADKKLTVIAVGSVNAAAATEWHESSMASDVIEKSAEWLGSAASGAVKTVKNLMPRSAAADRRNTRKKPARGRSGTTRGRKSGGSTRGR